MKYIKLFEDYESSVKKQALNQAKKELTIDTGVESGDYPQDFTKPPKPDPTEEDVKNVIAKSKSIETMRSWNPKVYDWLVKNDKLDWIKHLPKKSTATKINI
jgi:hypothetical protein